jgi:hypothetical protein
MEHTEETLLVGEDATNFAIEMGFKKQDLHTNKSREEYQQWLNNSCQPNYWKEGVSRNTMFMVLLYSFSRPYLQTRPRVVGLTSQPVWMKEYVTRPQEKLLYSQESSVL